MSLLPLKLFSLPLKKSCGFLFLSQSISCTAYTNWILYGTKWWYTPRGVCMGGRRREDGSGSELSWACSGRDHKGQVHCALGNCVLIPANQPQININWSFCFSSCLQAEINSQNVDLANVIFVSVFDNRFWLGNLKICNILVYENIKCFQCKLSQIGFVSFDVISLSTLGKIKTLFKINSW